MRCDDQRAPGAPDDLSTWSESRLLEAACGVEDDAEALNVLVGRHATALQRRCAILTQDREYAADLAQDTWTRVLCVRTTIGAEGSFGAYLAKIALNVWRDRRRAERHAHDLTEATSGSPADEEATLLRLDLANALARLPTRLREVVIARYVHGESAAEIGRRVGRTEQTVTAWLREATSRMRENLREWRPAA